MVEQGLSIWKRDFPSALESGRAQFMEHDFFTPNPVKEANVYWMRNVLYAHFQPSHTFPTLLPCAKLAGLS